MTGRLEVDAWLAGYGSQATQAAYRRDLDQWTGWLLERDVELLGATRPHVQVYARHLEDLGRAPATVARKLAALSAFYDFAAAEGYCVKSPASHVRRPHVSDDSPRLGLTKDELGRLLEAAAADVVDHALISLLALNGLRVSEACGAGVEDLVQEHGVPCLRIRRKGGKVALTPLAGRAGAAVLAAAGERTAGPLLGVDRFEAWRRVKEISARAAIAKSISPHSLRHTFCTLALDAGVPLHVVQDAMSHADPRTTRRYDRARHQLGPEHATHAVSDLFDVPAIDP